MSFQIPKGYEIAYDSNWKFTVNQQMRSLLGPLVIRDKIDGEKKRYNYIGKTLPRKVTSRLGASVPQDVPQSERWVRPQPYEQIAWIDENDKARLGSLSEPSNEFQEAHRRAFGLLEDQLIINAAVGTSYTGETGVTAIVLPSTQKVAVNYVPSGAAANSGLTLGKLVQAKFLMDVAHVPQEGRVLAHSAKQLADLLNNVVEIKSHDYNNVKALVEGRVSYFMGFQFVMVDKDALPYDSGTDIRKIVAFQKDGLVLGWGSNPMGRLDVLPTQRHALQVRSTIDYDAARLQEETVVEIATDESP